MCNGLDGTEARHVCICIYSGICIYIYRSIYAYYIIFVSFLAEIQVLRIFATPIFDTTGRVIKCKIDSFYRKREHLRNNNS